MSWPTRTAPFHGPLADVRVLDLSAYAVGPWAASLLAMLGADVVKVDPPYGDPIRAVRPQIKGEPTTYTTSNQGKRDIVLDLKSEQDLKVVRALASSADVVVENFRAGTLDRLGLGFAHLRKLNPRLVMVSSGSFGDKGPMAPVGSTDPHGQAFNGFVALNGVLGGDRQFLRYKALIDLASSTLLASSALLGLRYRARSGIGCHFESSQMEAALAIQVNRIAEYFASGRSPEPYGAGVEWLVPSGAYRTRDGEYLHLTAPSDETWRALCRVIGREELAERPDLASNPGRVAHREEVEEALAAAIAGRDIGWWRTRLTDAGVPNGERLILDEAIRFGPSHPLDRYLELVPHPLGGFIHSAAPPWRFSRTPAQISRAPLPGENSDEVRAGALAGEAPAVERPANNSYESSPLRPLAGLKVVEIGQGIATPYCGLLLAGTGADVLKLEPPEGDALARLGPPFLGQVSAAYAALNRGKRTARMDWRSEGGRLLLERVLREADVVLVDRGRNGFIPITDFDGREVAGNRRAVVVGISPLGEHGPLAEVPATELEVQAFSGITRYVGSVGEPPIRLGADASSILAGAFGFQAALAALHERDRSGTGQYVEVSGLASLISMETVMIAALSRPDAWEGFHCLAAGYPPEYGVRTADGAVSFNGPRRDEAAWVAFCEEIGAAGLATHPDFDTDAKRLPRSRELSEAIERYLRRFKKWDVVEVTTRHGGIAVPVQDYAEYFSHPQSQAMKVAGDWETQSGERFRALGLPWRIQGERPRPGPAPATSAGAADWRSAVDAWLESRAEAVR